MLKQIFISHSSEDKETAQNICHLLEEQGITCWIAPRDVTPGKNFGEEVISAIENTQAMVLLLSGNSNVSTYVVKEVERAIAKKKMVIPFRIQNIEPGKALELFLAGSHWIDAWFPPLEEKVRALAATINNLLKLSEKGDSEKNKDKALPQATFLASQKAASPISPTQNYPEEAVHVNSSVLGKVAYVTETSKKYTILQSLALEEGVTLSRIYSYELSRDEKGKIDLKRYSGILVFDIQGLVEDHLANKADLGLSNLREYAQQGGKIFFLLQPLSEICNTKLIEYFGITIVHEFIIGAGSGRGDARFSMPGSLLCPLFEGEVGSHLMDKSDPSFAPSNYTGPFIGGYFVCGKNCDVLEVKIIRSETSRKERVVACKLKIGVGEVWFVADFTCWYSADVAVNYYPMLVDKVIGNFDNELAAQYIIRWLSEIK